MYAFVRIVHGGVCALAAGNSVSGAAVEIIKAKATAIVNVLFFDLKIFIIFFSLILEILCDVMPKRI
jgi:hypothetical protein